MKAYNDCMEVREDFSAYLDGEMTSEARGPLEAHLAICADCLRELDALKRVDDSYRKLDRVAAPDNFEEGVREAVRAGLTTPAAGQRPIPRWTGPLVAMASAAAVLIVGVLVLQQRQPAPESTKLASAPAEKMNSANAIADETAAPKETKAESAAGAGGGGAAWDRFTRAPASSDTTWKSFAKAPAAADAAPSRGGREDNGEALAQNLSTADRRTKMPAADAAGELDATGTEARARAELIGTPPAAPALPPAAAAPEKVIDAPASQTDPKAVAGAAPAPVGAGEILNRQKLRSFNVRDGVWYESGYKDQPRTSLKRESGPLRELMKAHSGLEWGKLLSHTARQVFEIDGAWYELEPPPGEAK